MNTDTPGQINRLPICEFRHVSRVFRDGDDEVCALSDITVSVLPGEFIAIMGPSGSGKSSMLNLAGGLDVATSGQVLVGGHDLAGLAVSELAELRRRHVGFVFQRFNLLPTMTAVENVMMPLELDGIRPNAARNAAREALRSAGIADVADRFPDNLSGGQQQRVAIARAIVGDRKLLLADEPTGALDTATGERILELLADQAAAGRAVMLVTHEPRFASYADRVLHLRDGAMVETRDRVRLQAAL